MAARIHTTLLVAVAALAAAGPASAKVYVEWRPRISLFAGLNDNVPLDGSGGDAFGQARPGLKVDLFGDHQLHIDVDCQAGIGRLLHPERFAEGGAFASSEQCIASYRDRFSPRTTARVLLRGTYSQDPFALSGLGLLLRAGQTQVFSTRLNAEVEHTVSPRGQWKFAADAQVLAFGQNDPGNSALFMPSLGYAYRLSPYGTVEVTGREQLFYSFGATPQAAGGAGIPSGILSEGHSVLLGYVRRINPWSTLTVRGGPLYLTGMAGGQVSPVARIQVESVTPRAAIDLVVAHDLIIGASRAGPLVGDVAELALLGNLGDFTGHLRAGVYRNADVPTQFTRFGAAGYTGEAAVDYHLGREWTVGVAVLRDARLNDVNVGRQVDRDVVQLRLTWERFRPF